MNDRAKTRLTALARIVAGAALFAVFSPSEIGAQPTPTPRPAIRRFDRAIRADYVGGRSDPTPTPTPDRTIHRRDDHVLRHPVDTVPAGAIEARVLDRNGGALPGVTCRASSSDTGVSREAVTDQTGLCRLSLLPAGTYQFVAVRTGFFSTQRRIDVALGQTATANLTMGPAIILGPPPVVVGPQPTPPPPPPPAPDGPPPDARPTSPPRDGHPRPTPGPPGTIREMYWNSWIQNRRSEEAVSRVEVGELYNLNFDLAAFDYSTFLNAPGTGSVAVDEALRSVLNEYTGKYAYIHVKPVIGGRGLEFLSGSEESQRERVTMARLRTPPADWSRDDPLPEISEKVNAAQVQIGVRAREPGCASIGLSIWNEERDRPIDFLVRHISVGGNPNDPDCVGRDTTKRLQGNLISLLAMPPDQPVDAALHVFEMDDQLGPKSYVVFAARGEPVRSWVLARQLSRYVTEPTGLLNRLGIARSSRNYELIGSELREVLFTGESGQEQADAALRVLSNLAGRPKKATVFARLVDRNGRSLFLPLGLTAIRPRQLLGDAASVTLPLPRETYSGGQRCVQSWKMVLPEDLGPDVAGSFLTPITSPMSNRTSSWSELESYLRNPPADSSRAEGFLLLAHQGGGRLWFLAETSSSLLTDQISHKFPPGSVAVLAACSVGDVTAESSGVGLLDRINSLGIDAVIVSPFAVLGPVGARFAFHFADQIQKAQRAREAASLVELFQRATEATRGDTTIATDRNGVYEFLLAGNGGLRLCR